MPTSKDPNGHDDPSVDDSGADDPAVPLRTSTGIGRSVVRLRLLLASVERRHHETQRHLAALRQQLRRVPTRSVNGNLAVDAYLAVMAETRTRLAKSEQDLQDLELLKRRALQEIEALELMGRIQQTQQELAELREQARWDSRSEVLEEIRRLEAVVQDYTTQATQNIMSGGQQPPAPEPPAKST
ncbi:MAG: hypothetical protein EXR48_05520 [Dehalococcoidia bacterium]|nr:hypothetical protein [Dehalococcoidia bacterium]